MLPRVVRSAGRARDASSAPRASRTGIVPIPISIRVQRLASKTKERWDKHNEPFELGVVSTICNANEAAVYHHHKIRGNAVIVKSIEAYCFEPSRLFGRYFFIAPDANQVELTRFRSFSA